MNSAGAFKLAMASESNSTASATSSTEASVWPDRPPRIDKMRTKGNRILWLESTLAWGIYGSGKVNSVADGDQKATSPEKEKEWGKRIKELVADDARKPPTERIDSVAWFVKHGNQPTTWMWKALDGLSPKHLHIVCGFDEECRIKPLRNLQHQWVELETLTLTNNINPDIFKESPEVLSQITSLTLDHCCAWDLVPSNAKRLKDLRIFENNACDMFCYAVDDKRNPGFAKQLEVLLIQTTNGCDMGGRYEPKGFRLRLQRCTKLRELHYTAGMINNLDVRLAEYIPKSVEKLTLGFTRSLPFLREFGDWIECASDPTWLPRLKSFKMTVDSGSRVKDLRRRRHHPPWNGVVVDPSPDFTAERFDQEFEAKRRKLYDLIKSNKPSVELLE